MRKNIMAVTAIAGLLFLSVLPVHAGNPAVAEADEELARLIESYQAYEADFAAIETTADIEENGFYVIEDQSFPVMLESFGEEEVTFLPVMDRKYHRLAVIIADREGRILFKTNQLETNNRRPGELEQLTKGIAAVSFRDLNGDGLTDIILITNCENKEGKYAEIPYKVGDVLFQAQGKFYRDWRISDKINRFSMNKGIDCIEAYVRDGNSTEILYTATTLEELLDNGFRVIQEQSYRRKFEKQGFLKIVPGVIRLGRYDIFMIFLVNDQGSIVYSLQPMEDYDSLYAMKGMTCQDMDGDGMKDIVILGKYTYTGPDGEAMKDIKCSIYYQRTDGFAEDKEFNNYHPCTEEDRVGNLVGLIREYWGWSVEVGVNDD